MSLCSLHEFVNVSVITMKLMMNFHSHQYLVFSSTWWQIYLLIGHLLFHTLICNSLLESFESLCGLLGFLILYVQPELMPTRLSKCWRTLLFERQFDIMVPPKLTYYWYIVSTIEGYLCRPISDAVVSTLQNFVARSDYVACSGFWWGGTESNLLSADPHLFTVHLMRWFIRLSNIFTVFVRLTRWRVCHLTLRSLPCYDPFTMLSLARHFFVGCPSTVLDWILHSSIVFSPTVFVNTREYHNYLLCVDSSLFCCHACLHMVL